MPKQNKPVILRIIEDSPYCVDFEGDALIIQSDEGLEHVTFLEMIGHYGSVEKIRIEPLEASVSVGHELKIIL